MYAEEFILIPRKTYAPHEKTVPQSQILHNPLLNDKSSQLNYIQHFREQKTSRDSPPPLNPTSSIQSIQFFNPNLEELQSQLAERRQIQLRDQQFPAEMKELVKTDNVEEIHSVQATFRVPAHFAGKFKSKCKHEKLTK